MRATKAVCAPDMAPVPRIIRGKAIRIRGKDPASGKDPVPRAYTVAILTEAR